MAILLTATVLIVAIAALAIYMRVKGGTLFVIGRRGFRAFQFGIQRSTPADRSEVETAIARLIEGSTFDHLWMSPVDSEVQGIILYVDDAGIHFDVDFMEGDKQSRSRAFRAAMIDLGHKPAKEMAWNMGDGPETESITFEYVLPNDIAGVVQVCFAALGPMSEDGGETFFIRAWRDANGPPPKPGIFFRQYEHFF